MIIIGEAVVGGGAVKQQKKAGAAADVRNRRALGDIGNLVTLRGVDGKPQPQITRPITRSFCAQLLAKAQAAAAAENNKVGLFKPKCSIFHLILSALLC